MNERSHVQRIVSDLKHGLLEIESHVSLLKKRIYDLEGRLAQVVRPADFEADEAKAPPTRHGRHSDDRMLPFSFLESMGS